MELGKKIEFEEDFTKRVSNYRAIIFDADVVNTVTSDEQCLELNAIANEIADAYKIEEINSIPAIAATRNAYKACGKDPNRNRPSQVQMMRRIVRGVGLYNVNALVDAGNEFSLKTGCSVGCFDAEKLVGDTITLGVGRHGEPYEGIGRGPLNIEGLPVFRDALGGFGTPTSDNERTKLTLDTKKIFVTVHLFDPSIDADVVKNLFISIFERWGSAKNINWKLFRP